MKFFIEFLFAKKAQRALQRGTVAILCTLLIGFFITVSCEEPTALNTPQSDDPALLTTKDSTATNLAGTAWKLLGFVNNQTQKTTMIEAEPKCDRCYTLVFDTDTTASGYSFANIIRLDLKPVLLMGVGTMVNDIWAGNVSLFYEAMESVGSYIVENDALKIFYNNNQNYLLYKPYSYEGE